MFSATAVGSRCPCGCGRGWGRGVTVYRYGIMAQTLARPAVRAPRSASAARGQGKCAVASSAGKAKRQKWLAGTSAVALSLPTKKNIAVTVAWHGTKMASARLLIRERGGNSVPVVFNTESQAASFRARIAKGTVVHADEAARVGTIYMSVSR